MFSLVVVCYVYINRLPLSIMYNRMILVTGYKFVSMSQAGNCLRRGVESVNRTPLPLKVSKFGWNYTFSGGNFPISTVFVTLYRCQMLAKHINLSTIHSLDLKDTTNYYLRIKNQIHALSTVPYVSHLPLLF